MLGFSIILILKGIMTKRAPSLKSVIPYPKKI